MASSTDTCTSRYIERSSQHLDCEVDGEVVLMNIEDGKYYNLNPPASEIWRLLAQPKTKDQLVEGLTEKFEVGREQCATEVEEFLGGLERDGILCFR